jgi:hypothetical protein
MSEIKLISVLLDRFQKEFILNSAGGDLKPNRSSGPPAKKSANDQDRNFMALKIAWKPA